MIDLKQENTAHDTLEGAIKEATAELNFHQR